MMRLILFVAAAFLLTFYESECVTCTFTYDILDYGCQLNNQTVQSEDDLAVIDGIHLDGYTDQNVRWVSSNNSRISVFPNRLVEHFPNVIRAFFAESQMTSLGEAISCAQLTFIDLNGNSLTNIPDGLFARCPRLQYLLLSENNLERIDELTFSGSTNLESLNVEKNNLSSIHPRSFESLVSLTTIYLGSNKLETLDPRVFRNCSRLSYIYINDNRITTLADDFFINLPLLDVDLSQNRISSIGPTLFSASFWPFANLNLSYNLIEELPVFDDVGRVSGLYLDSNQIRKIRTNTFRSFTNLFRLSLNDNHIDELQPEAFPEYFNNYRLYLNSNNISTLQPGSFSRTSIDELWLSDNQLTHLNANAFAQMTDLYELHADRNRIETVDRKLFEEAPRLFRLNLTDNVCANESFEANLDLTWPNLGTCSSVKIQANLIALLLVLLTKIVI